MGTSRLDRFLTRLADTSPRRVFRLTTAGSLSDATRLRALTPVERITKVVMLATQYFILYIGIRVT